MLSALVRPVAVLGPACRVNDPALPQLFHIPEPGLVACSFNSVVQIALDLVQPVGLRGLLFGPAVVEDDLDEIITDERWVEVFKHVGVHVSEGAARPLLVAVGDRLLYPAF